MTRSFDLADISRSGNILTVASPGASDPSASLDVGYGFGWGMGGTTDWDA
tara:strand:+ start:1929 stop:2078 length:150 start_codon:yes stop_codon:yes gene_type:complete